MPAITPFSDEDFDTLGNWLVRRAKGISDIVELEGFLTAIVIGPNTLSPLARTEAPARHASAAGTILGHCERDVA